MKLIRIALAFFIYVLLHLSVSSCSKSSSYRRPYTKFLDPRAIVLKKLNLGVASIALANVFTRLGSRSTVINLAIRIQKRCKGNTLLNSWLKIIKINKKWINNSTKHPFNIKRYLYIYDRHRKSVFRQFIKTFIKCGLVRGSRNQIKLLRQAYYSSNKMGRGLLVNLILTLKRIFLRKKIIRSNHDNKTIYPTRLLHKMIILRGKIANCLRYKKFCKNFGNHCAYYRYTCKFTSLYRDRIIYKVRKIFTYYFSQLFSVIAKSSKYIKSNMKRGRKIYKRFFYKTPF